MKFQTETYGKWILTGEHTVLRGGAALVFPLKSLSLKFSEVEAYGDLAVTCSGKTGAEYHMLVYGLVDQACEILKISRGSITGKFHLQTDLPLGGGLGASAALCVAVGRLMAHRGFVVEENLYEFCRQLENLFHGESSGVDIAVSLAGEPLMFHRKGPREVFNPGWQPHLYISYSGQRGLTQECVNQVKALIQAEPQLGEKLDEQMKKATRLAIMALGESQSQETGLGLLSEAIKWAAASFEAWGLTEGLTKTTILQLQDSGAIAVKPTGSGGGGYILSLWSSEPTRDLQEKFNLISCFGPVFLSKKASS